MEQKGAIYILTMQTLAQANNLNVSDTYTEQEHKDVLLKLRRNLVRQKAIFDKAA